MISGGQKHTASPMLRVITPASRAASATASETRVGFRPASADGLPLLGHVRGVDGLLVGNGLGAAGLTIGPFAGRLLADMVLGRETGMDLRPFDPLRRAGPGLRSAIR